MPNLQPSQETKPSMNTSPEALPQGVARDADEVVLMAKVAAKSKEQRAAEAKRFAELFS